MIRDAQATQQRLLDAATAEFATYGIEGARVDRIAAAASSNKAQIYHYFGSKDRLFDAVWESLVERVVTDVPLDVDDLPGYAVRLAEGYAQNPALARLITWQRLERSDDAPLPASIASVKSKIDAIRSAQEQGLVSTRFSADALLMLILHIAAMWSMSSPDVLAAMGERGGEERLQTVRVAVERLLS
jgi:AcrR family transcriptional regulator